MKRKRKSLYFNKISTTLMLAGSLSPVYASIQMAIPTIAQSVKVANEKIDNISGVEKLIQDGNLDISNYDVSDAVLKQIDTLSSKFSSFKINAKQSEYFSRITYTGNLSNVTNLSIQGASDGQNIILPSSTTMSNITTLTVNGGNKESLDLTNPKAYKNLKEIDFSNVKLNGKLEELESNSAMRKITLNNVDSDAIDLSKFNNHNLTKLNMANMKGITNADSIQKLTKLTYLDLSNDDLIFKNSSINAIMNQSIEFLSLSNNKIDGTLKDLVKDNHGISYINLASTGISGDINDLLSVHGLNTVIVDYNSGITGNLDTVNASKDLKVLSGTWTNVSGTLSNLDTYTKLENISLGSTKITDIPRDLSALTELNTLVLTDDKISGEVPLLGNKLQYVYLEGNSFTGKLPDFSKLTDLKTYDVGSTKENKDTGNKLSGTLTGLQNAKDLEYINVSYQDVTGELPNLTGLTHLKTFMADYTGLTGKVLLPESPLETLSFDHTHFTGDLKLPSSSMKTLHYLNFNANQLSGDIQNFSQFEALEKVYLGDNSFTGNVVLPEKGKTVLQTISVANNKTLTGEIENLDTSVNLEDGYFSNNQFTGSLNLFNLNKLRFIDVNTNNMDGAIILPSDKTHLETLYAATNKLTGDVPSFADYTNLAHVTLRDNKLTGSFNLDNDFNLQDFIADTNQISGQVPNLQGFNKLTVFDVGTNKLTGEVPDMSNMESLATLGLANNGLVGKLNLENDTKLSTVNASMNKFDKLPDFKTLTSLSYFDMGNNVMTGSINLDDVSDTIGTFAVANNHLSGNVTQTKVLPNMSNFQIQSNKDITGKLESLSEMPKITYYDASDNKITGVTDNLKDIPDTLTTLSLANNKMNLVPTYDKEEGKTYNYASQTLSTHMKNTDDIIDLKTFFNQVGGNLKYKITFSNTDSSDDISWLKVDNENDPTKISIVKSHYKGQKEFKFHLVVQGDGKANDSYSADVLVTLDDTSRPMEILSSPDFTGEGEVGNSSNILMSANKDLKITRGSHENAKLTITRTNGWLHDNQEYAGLLNMDITDSKGKQSNISLNTGDAVNADTYVPDLSNESAKNSNINATGSIATGRKGDYSTNITYTLEDTPNA